MKKIIITITFLIVTLISFSQIKSTLSATRVVKVSGIFKSPPPSKTINIQIDAEKVLRETNEEESLGACRTSFFSKIGHFPFCPTFTIINFVSFIVWLYFQFNIQFQAGFSG
ncbi:MAG: hypothetical protein Q8S54_01035, partial [Bacteroidota bacterium]|nr:hypothetical protein [Bacteroidota bacterium]